MHGERVLVSALNATEQSVIQLQSQLAIEVTPVPSKQRDRAERFLLVKFDTLW